MTRLAQKGTLRLVADGERPERDGGPIGLEDAYVRYGRYVATVAYRLLGRDDEVDDAVQEVFVEASKGLASVRDPGALRGWLRTIAVRVVSRRLRARRLRRFFGMEHGVDYDTMPSLDESPETRLLFARVYRALDRLPIAERVAWTLRHVEGASLDEVAEHCSCSLATAKRRIAAAQTKLQEEVSDA